MADVEGVTTLTNTSRLGNDVPAGDERAVRGSEDEGSYDEVSRRCRAAPLATILLF